MKCPKCGIELVRGEKVCWQCYTPLEGPGPGRPAGPAGTPTAPRRAARKRKPWLAPVVAAVVILAGVGGGLYYRSEYTGPKGCARAYCAAIEKGDTKAISALVSSKDKRGVFGQVSRQLATAAVQHDKDVAVKAVVTEVQQTGDTAQAKVRITMTRKNLSKTLTDTQPLVMVREPGGWRLDMQATMRAQLEAMGISLDQLKDFPQP